MDQVISFFKWVFPQNWFASFIWEKDFSNIWRNCHVSTKSFALWPLLTVRFFQTLSYLIFYYPILSYTCQHQVFCTLTTFDPEIFSKIVRWCDFLHILLCGHIWNVQWRKGNTCKVFSFSCVFAWVMMPVMRWWLVMIATAEMRQFLGAPPMICGAGLPADVGSY